MKIYQVIPCERLITSQNYSKKEYYLFDLNSKIREIHQILYPTMTIN